VSPPKSQKATVEDVEDEDVAAARKKKKKKKKKKRTETSETPSSQLVQSIKPTTAQTSTELVLASPTKASSSVPSTSSTLPAYMSTTSLVPTAEPETAQSAHSYLQSLSVSEKKVKSRPDHASLFSQPETEKKGFFSGLSLMKKGKDKESQMKEARQSWFSKLSKKTKTHMHQLLNTSENDKTGAPMKWETFIKVIGVFFWIFKYTG
jgi:hypothetical protein